MATVDARNSRLHDIEKMVSKVQLELDNRDYSKFTSHIVEIFAMAKTKDSTFDKEMVLCHTIEKYCSVSKIYPNHRASVLSLPELET